MSLKHLTAALITLTASFPAIAEPAGPDSNEGKDLVARAGLGAGTNSI